MKLLTLRNPSGEGLIINSCFEIKWSRQTQKYVLKFYEHVIIGFVSWNREKLHVGVYCLYNSAYNFLAKFKKNLLL
jgi:hypothetical protein